MRHKLIAILLTVVVAATASLTNLRGQSGGGNFKICDNGFAGCVDYPNCYPLSGICQDDLGNDFSYDRLDTEAEYIGHCRTHTFASCSEQAILSCSIRFWQINASNQCVLPVCEDSNVFTQACPNPAT